MRAELDTEGGVRHHGRSELSEADSDIKGGVGL